MGSMIHLTAGHIYIDAGKNRGYVDHGLLFQAGDESLGPYKYVDINSRQVFVEDKECFSRPLKRIAPRLERLGYTLDACKEWLLCSGYANCLTDPPAHSFAAFCKAVRSLPWSVETPYEDIEYRLSLAYTEALVSEGMSREAAAGYSFVHADPYVILRVLAQFSEYDNLPIRWEFADVVDNGWVERDEIKPGHPDGFLVVTEGTSDAFILQRSLAVLFPDVSDFFDFIDMKDGNPFPGVGNLVQFCKGLSRIRYAGKMLVVLDNDAAGREALIEIQKLNLSDNVIATTLPSIPELCNFKAVGPEGVTYGDINGRASAIECFLDLGSLSIEPAVRWTSYKKTLDCYQGELIRKDDYTRLFRERFGIDASYDASKLKRLWEHLFSVSTIVKGFQDEW